jgi:hypothetical protein
VALGWTTDCQKCHIAVSWTRAYFKHPAAFPLVGGHGNLACAACHKGGVFAALPTDCVSCHLANYQKTTNPNHIAAGFSTDCASCHNINSWQGAKFTHTPLFPLTGRHATLGCTSCHKTGVFTAMSTACVSCHLADYQNTKSPNHVASGFSTECATCHNTTSWQGAKFAHAFPIAAGPHAIACVQCHPNPANDTIFVCTNCHAHAQAAMSAAHREVKGYQWVSQSCYQCHRNGRAGD